MSAGCRIDLREYRGLYAAQGNAGQAGRKAQLHRPAIALQYL
jgi:hypothetical protein